MADTVADIVITVVCEAEADRRTACTLLDRVVCEHVEWIDQDAIEHFRRYCGSREGEVFLKWTDMARLGRAYRPIVRGHKDGRPREPEEAMAEVALLLLAALEPPPSAVVITRDADKESRRREGFEQARDARRWPFEVIVGVADTKRECWGLAGYEPRDAAEQALLDRERKDLGFDPRLSAEQLTASEDGAKRDAKRVLRVLTGGDRDREDACLKEPPLALLKQRGTTTGLAPYLLEVEARLVPLFDPAAAR